MLFQNDRCKQKPLYADEQTFLTDATQECIQFHIQIHLEALMILLYCTEKDFPPSGSI